MTLINLLINNTRNSSSSKLLIQNGSQSASEVVFVDLSNKEICKSRGDPLGLEIFSLNCFFVFVFVTIILINLFIF